MWECYWHLVPGFPVSTIHRPNVGSMLHHRLRRWPSIEPTSGLCMVFAGLSIVAFQRRVWMGHLLPHTGGDSRSRLFFV